MNRPLLIDTDVLIDFLRGHKQAVAFFRAETSRACFSSVTVAEIYAGIRDGKEEAEIERIFAVFPVLPPTREISRQAGKLVRQYGKAYSVEIPDALIAATCADHQAELATLNVRHYPMFKNLAPAYKKA